MKRIFIFLSVFISTSIYGMTITAQRLSIYEQVESCYVYTKVLGFDDEEILKHLYRHSLNPHYPLSQDAKIQLSWWGINPEHPLTREIVRAALKTTQNFNLITLERPFNDQTHRLSGKSNHQSYN